MCKRTIEKAIPIQVREAWLPELRNEYRELGSIRSLARLAVGQPTILTALATFAANEGNRHGYSKRHMSRLRKKVFLCPIPRSALKETVKSLEDLACDYEVAVSNGRLGDDQRNRVRHDFTAALSESITVEFLLASGRSQEGITSDAHFYAPPDPSKPSPSNIDIVWAAPASRLGELYECKNDPRRLLDPYEKRTYPGHEATWRKSQLHLMLAIAELLANAGWRVHLGCITLRTREFSRYPNRPAELSIWGREDLGTNFPPPLPD